jgi:maltose-binding protein MalE
VSWRWLLLAALVAALMGCAGDSAPASRIVLWHSYAGAERSALEHEVDRLNAAHPEHRVVLVAVPYEAFADKITNAIPNGNGPDLFIFAHDRIGDWVASGIVEPIEYYVDDELADRYARDAIAAMAYDDSLYGLPLAVKSAALFYRTDLVDEPPATTDELLAMGHRLTHDGHFGLVYKNTDLYGHAPWLHGFGGSVFDENGELDLASPEAVAAASFARELGGKGGIVPPDVTGTMVSTLFNAGKAAMAISGPWFTAELEPGVPWAVAPLPRVSATGLPASPFLGAEGVLMSSHAHDKDAAFTVMAALASDESAERRAREARQVVPNQAAYAQPDIGGDRVLAAFRAQAEHAVPMPATPEMRMVWTPYETALQKIIAQGADAEDTLRDAQHEVAGYIAGTHKK